MTVVQINRDDYEFVPPEERPGLRSRCAAGCIWRVRRTGQYVVSLPCPHRPVFGKKVEVCGTTVGLVASINRDVTRFHSIGNGRWGSIHDTATAADVLTAARAVGSPDAYCDTDRDERWNHSFRAAELLIALHAERLKIAEAEQRPTHPNRSSLWQDAQEGAAALYQLLQQRHGISRSDVEAAYEALGVDDHTYIPIALANAVEWVEANKPNPIVAAAELDQLLGD